MTFQIVYATMGILQFLVWALGDRPGKAIYRLCGDRTEIMLCQSSCRAVSVVSAWEIVWPCASSIQRLHGDGAVTVRGPYNYPKSL